LTHCSSRTLQSSRRSKSPSTNSRKSFMHSDNVEHHIYLSNLFAKTPAYAIEHVSAKYLISYNSDTAPLHFSSALLRFASLVSGFILQQTPRRCINENAKHKNQKPHDPSDAWRQTNVIYSHSAPNHQSLACDGKGVVMVRRQMLPQQNAAHRTRELRRLLLQVRQPAFPGFSSVSTCQTT
jgi:hypothetical protein